MKSSYIAMNKSSNRFFANSFGIRNLPNIILCICIGFLGVLFFKNAYQEIKVIDYEDVTFQAAKIVIGTLFLLGFILKRALVGIKSLYLDYSILILLIVEMITLSGFSSGLLQVDYIFYTDIFLFFASINSMATGMLAAGLKDFRLWSFLMGGTSYVIYSNLNPSLIIKSENYLMPLVFVLTLELILFSIIPTSANGSTRQNQKTHPANNIYFYSSLSLFVFHSILYSLNMQVPDSYLLGTGLGILLFNIIFHFGFLSSKLKWKFLAGRGILLFSLILTLHESKFELSSGLLLFLDTACIAIYRPGKYKLNAIFLSVLSGIALYVIDYFLNIYYLQYEFRYAFVLAFIILAWTPFILLDSVKILNKSITILLSFTLSAFFFSPLPYDHKMNFVKTENLKPIPYLLSTISLNEENFVYFNVNLPFRNEETLPKKNTFRNKTIILGLGENLEITLTYLYHLNKNGYPFIIFQDRNSRTLRNNLIEFDSIEYPLFRIYFPKNSIPTLQLEKESIKKAQSWEVQHIESRLKSLETNEDIANTISNIISYSNGSLKEVAIDYRNKFYNSYKSYAEYYHKTSEYDKSVQMSNIAFQFLVKDDNLLDTTYNSLLHITPEKDQIPVMNILLSKNIYKEQIIKRLYPMLLTLNKKDEALEKINELMNFYQNSPQDHTEELKNLKIEKAKIYLQFSNIREAEEIILSESKKYSGTSVVWQKLVTELTSLKESSIRIYSHPAINPNSIPQRNPQ